MKEHPIETVARLKELEAKMVRAPWSNCYYHRPSEDETLVALRNAAPLLLDVLSEIRPGDADILYWMLTGVGNEPSLYDIAELLSRYCNMARKMEASK